MKKIIKLLATFFYIGYLKPIPGTYACLATIFLYAIFIRDNLLLHCLFLIFFLIAGFITAGKAEKLFDEKDPKQIVIDEVAGMLLALLFLPFKPIIFVSAFILFRIFDVLKPPPIRRLEKLPGSLGIMLDDIIAALYANLALQIFIRIFMHR